MRPLMFACFSVSLAGAAGNALPPFTREVLSNGVVLYAMPKKEVPLVTVRVQVRGGAESDPEGKAGLSAITAEMLRRGTKKRSADEFALALEFLGASLNAGSSQQSTNLSLECLTTQSAKATPLLTEMLLEPAFDGKEFQKLIAQRRDQLRQMKDNPMAVVAPYFRAFLFGPLHPYGWPAEGDEVSLANLTLDDVAGCHKRMYVGANLTVIVAGEFDPALKEQIGSALAGLPRGTAYAWKQARRPSPARRLLLVDKPDATQTYFQFGHAGINRTNPDRVPVLLVNTVFGGRFTSMLNDALRVNAGLTYGAQSYFTQDRLDGAFAVTSYTRTATTEKAIGMALDLLKTLREKGIDAEQLASAKAYMKGNYPTRNLETSSQLADILGQMETFGLKRGEWDDLFSRIDAVTLEQANAAAKKYFGSEELVFTLIGNAAAIKDQVGKYAKEVIVTPISAPGYGSGRN